MKSVITKYLSGSATQKEQRELLNWLRNKKNRSVFNDIKLQWKKEIQNNNLSPDGEKNWDQVRDRLLEDSYLKWQNAKKIQLYFKVAAVFILLVSLSGLTYYFNQKLSKLGNFYTSVVADYGHISKVELPDGSLVWLNSGSQLKYNNQFASKNRIVQLTGEAYFKAAKNENLPLVVQNGIFDVKVLGTKFNVSAYPNADFIDVVLEEGLVELISPNSGAFISNLKPGEHARFDRAQNNLDIKSVNTAKFTSWKDGIINIYNQPLHELIKRLETRYNQKFIIEEDVKELHYTFTIKNESLDEIIHLMEKITPVKAVQKNDVILFQLKKS